MDNGSALKMASQLLLANTVTISVGSNIIYTQYRTKEALHDIHSSSIYVLWMNMSVRGELKVLCQCQSPVCPYPPIHWSSHLISKVLQIPLPRCWRLSIKCQSLRLRNGGCRMMGPGSALYHASNQWIKGNQKATAVIDNQAIHSSYPFH